MTDIKKIDYSIFDLPRVKNILAHFEYKYPKLNTALRKESIFYEELHPIVEDYLETFRTSLVHNRQENIAHETAYKQTIELIQSIYQETELKLKNHLY